MNQALLYALLGAGVGYMNSRTKTGRKKAAMKGAALGYFAVAVAAPRLGINLPDLRALARTS